MYNFQRAGKGVLFAILAALPIYIMEMRSADAANYIYTLTNPTTLAVTGSITTTCDNCVLNASNISAWRMSLPGAFDISSTSPGAAISVSSGENDMVATPNAINFNFAGDSGGISFITAGYIFGFGDDQGGNIGFGPGEGVIDACNPTIPGTDGCAFIVGESGNQAVATVGVPFAGSVNYTFAGTVTGATGIYASAGTTVTGTLTFDLNAGDGALPVSTTTPWSSASTGTPQVVMSTLKSGSVTFSDAGSVSNKTTVAGLATTGSSAPNEYFASDTEFSSATNSVAHSFQIVGGSGAKTPFNSNGLPIFQNATGTGRLLATSGGTTVGQLNYTITSLSAAPTTLSVSPASLTFPNTLPGAESAPLTLTVKNTSSNDVSISAVGFNPDRGSFRLTADNCDVVLSANASCTVSIIFAPDQAGLTQTSFTVTDSAQGSPQAVALSATGTVAPAPVVTLTAPFLDFVGQVGTTSSAKALTLKNTGNAPLSIFYVALVGAQSDVFTLRNACVPTLAPGQACTVFVSFSPVAAGPVSASLVISDNIETGAANGFGQTIGLGGTGTTTPVSGLTLSATSLDFSNQTIGMASVKQAINLTNTGAAPLTISSIALTGAQAKDFMLQNACTPTLAIGQRCAVFVTFKPLTAGDLTAAVVIKSNSGGSGSIATLTGTATAATAPVLTLSTTNLDFPIQAAGTASATRAIELTNSGTAPLSLSIAVIGEEEETDDFIVRNACTPSLAPGQHCTVFVTFKPLAGGTYFATLVITDNEPNLQQTVQVAGSTGT